MVGVVECRAVHRENETQRLLVLAKKSGDLSAAQLLRDERASTLGAMDNQYGERTTAAQ